MSDSSESNAVKTILSLGEEKMGEVVGQLLANESFVRAMQTAVVSGLSAKRNLDRGLASVLGLVNIPTVDDVDKVRGRLMEVEELMGEIGDRLAGLHDRIEGVEDDEETDDDDA
jgi:hypothetical protein